MLRIGGRNMSNNNNYFQLKLPNVVVEEHTNWGAAISGLLNGLTTGARPTAKNNTRFSVISKSQLSDKELKEVTDKIGEYVADLICESIQMAPILTGLIPSIKKGVGGKISSELQELYGKYILKKNIEISGNVDSEFDVMESIAGSFAEYCIREARNIKGTVVKDHPTLDKGFRGFLHTAEDKHDSMEPLQSVAKSYLRTVIVDGAKGLSKKYGSKCLEEQTKISLIKLVKKNPERFKRLVEETKLSNKQSRQKVTTLAEEIVKSAGVSPKNKTGEQLESKLVGASRTLIQGNLGRIKELVEHVNTTEDSRNKSLDKDLSIDLISFVSMKVEKKNTMWLAKIFQNLEGIGPVQVKQMHSEIGDLIKKGSKGKCKDQAILTNSIGSVVEEIQKMDLKPKLPKLRGSVNNSSANLMSAMGMKDFDELPTKESVKAVSRKLKKVKVELTHDERVKLAKEIIRNSNRRTGLDVFDEKVVLKREAQAIILQHILDKYVGVDAVVSKVVSTEPRITTAGYQSFIYRSEFDNILRENVNVDITQNESNKLFKKISERILNEYNTAKDHKVVWLHSREADIIKEELQEFVRGKLLFLRIGSEILSMTKYDSPDKLPVPAMHKDIWDFILEKCSEKFIELYPYTVHFMDDWYEDSSVVSLPLQTLLQYY